MPRRKLNQSGPPPAPGINTLDVRGSMRLAMKAEGLPLLSKLSAGLDCARLTCTRGILPEEYFLRYHFQRLPSAEQSEFLTLLEAQRMTWRLSRDIRDTFWHKDRFLEAFSIFAKRDWLLLREDGLERFLAFQKKHPRFIAKPRASTEGMGIRLLEPDKAQDLAQLFRELLDAGCVLEEVLQGDSRLEAFHPNSLNTLRLVTLYNGREFLLLGALARFGRGGSAIDNVSAGGLYAKVDPVTGMLVTDGIDKEGRRYAEHPDSGLPFKGFQVPEWPGMLETARKAVTIVPNTRIAGWDLALLRDGGIALIEGNHMPDFDLLQQPAGRGIKREFEEAVRRMFGEAFLLEPINDGKEKG